MKLGLIRSTRGRVGLLTLAVFLVLGSGLYLLFSEARLIDALQETLENSDRSDEFARLFDEYALEGAIEPSRNGRTRTVVLPRASVSDFPIVADLDLPLLGDDVDVSVEGLDPEVLRRGRVEFSDLYDGGWRIWFNDAGAIPSSDVTGNSEPVVLVGLTTDAVLGPFSVSEVLLMLIPIGSVIFAIAFAAVAGTGLKPVRRMTDEAAAIQIDDLDRRLAPPGTGDELSRLADTLNGMLDTLDEGVAKERRFVADAAHELRSPIAASTALLEVSLGTDDLDWPVAAASVLGEQQRLGRLVDDLVLLARLDDAGSAARGTRVVDLDDVIVTETSRPFRTEIRVADIEPVRMVGDQASLERVVRNLLANADRHAASLVEVRLGASGEEGIRLVVDDDGPGVPVAERERVFERFARLDDARSRDEGGSGIGLAVVRQVVRLHGGSVRIEDSHLGGARFSIRWPEARPA